MLVRWDEIPETGLELNITDDAWLAGWDIRWQGPAIARIFLERMGERVLLEGALSLTALLECDRCLATYECPLESAFRIDFELAAPQAGPAAAEADHLCSSEEMDTLFLDEPVIDVTSVLSQQLSLALPAKKLCRPECRGLCPGCGADLNSERCACREETASSPFSVLARLKKKEN